MKNFKLVNNLFGWITFLIAAITYLLTIEPTASFWDCGEFISTAYKLDVGHPPGAPFFMLAGRFFANFTNDPMMVAKMVNSMSAIFSALTILFLFWTITHLAKKIVPKNVDNMSLSEQITIIGSGLVGALAYTFSDTFWFSAVEGEVYAFSSLFTAVVFWAMLKWEDISDRPDADKWIILIAYLMGLSVGVHLLNLLCIPALVLIYYFKKAEKVTPKGSIMALLVSIGLIAVVLYGIVPGFVKMAGWFDLFFVNVVGLPFNMGAVIFVAFVAAFLIWGLYETFSGKSEMRMKLAFCANLILVGIPFIGSSFLVWVLLCAALVAFVFVWKGWNAKLFNTTLLSLMVVVIGYSSYGVTVIRSSAKPPMDQNSPNNMFTLKSYLNREQYGDSPLVYGKTFASQVDYKPENGGCVPIYKKGETIWSMKVKETPNEKDKYFKSGTKDEPVMVSECNMFFPRMYSNQPDHIQSYKMWSDFKGKRVRFNLCGQTQTVLVPTMGENLKYFLSYQVNFMYWRYFMWNFAGRQNDIQGHGELQNGNWISGIPFIDNLLVGDQSSLPSQMKNNKGRNTYFLLPLLLGLIGIAFQAFKGEKGIQGFWVTFFLFFMTGLAIVLYLNQPPLQPRERDYAYAGSFYAFTIWIGLGVAGIVHYLKKYVSELPAAAAVSIVCLGVPALMAAQNWDDHDRSDRYTTRDFARNYLESCDKNAIIFTNGDNDTFPLWYVQEVEGFRTDVRVCNLSYLQTDWYAAQMSRPYYDSKALPIGWTPSMYYNGKRDYARIYKLTEDSVSLDVAMSWLETDDAQYKKIPGIHENIDYIPASKLYMDVDKAEVIKNGYVDPKFKDLIVDRFTIDLKDRSYLYKSHLLILEMIQENKWKRPICFAISVDDANYLGMSQNFIQEGLSYKLSPIVNNAGGPLMNSDKMYDLMMNKFKYGNVADPSVYLDENVLRMCRTHRALFSYLVRTLVAENKFEMAEKAVDYSLKVLPIETVLVNSSLIEFADAYYTMGKKEKGTALSEKCIKTALEHIRWADGLKPDQYMSAGQLVQSNMMMFHYILNLYQKYEPALFEKYLPDYAKYGAKYEQLFARK